MTKMKEPTQDASITRKQFLECSFGLIGCVAGITALTGCGGGNGSKKSYGSSGGGTTGGTTGGGTTGGTTGGGTTGGMDAGMEAGQVVDMCSTDVEFVMGHTHQVRVPPEDVEAGKEKVYMLSNVGHTHSLTVTVDDFATLASGETVEIESSVNAGHRHNVTVMCS